MSKNPECEKTPDFVKAVLAGPTDVVTKEALLAHCMKCLPCLDVFKNGVARKINAGRLTDPDLVFNLRAIKDPYCDRAANRIEELLCQVEGLKGQSEN